MWLHSAKIYNNTYQSLRKIIKTITGCQNHTRISKLAPSIQKKISNNMNVSIYLLKKTYKISKNYTKIHENLQVTYKILEKINLHSTDIIITHTIQHIKKLKLIRT